MIDEKDLTGYYYERFDSRYNHIKNMMRFYLKQTIDYRKTEEEIELGIYLDEVCKYDSMFFFNVPLVYYSIIRYITLMSLKNIQMKLSCDPNMLHSYGIVIIDNVNMVIY